MSVRVTTPQCEESPDLNVFPQYKNFKKIVLIALKENSWIVPKELIYEEVTRNSLRKMLSEPPTCYLLKDLDKYVRLNSELILAHTLVVPEGTEWDYKWRLTFLRRKGYYMQRGYPEDAASHKAKLATSRAANKRQQRIEGVANTHRRMTRVELRSNRLKDMTPEQLRSELDNIDDYMESLAAPVGGNYEAARKKGRK